jgi:hypothetical protein
LQIGSGEEMQEDTHLILLALAKTNASTIHDVNGLVALYRGSIASHPEIAGLYERGLQAFVLTGKMAVDCRKKKYIDLHHPKPPLQF